VISPPIAARVEELYDGSCARIDPGKIWALVQIAELARICQVFKIVRTTVLDGNNVLNVEPVDIVRITEPAVLANVPGTEGHSGASRTIHARIRQLRDVL
jgi:hypothetical protein